MNRKIEIVNTLEANSTLRINNILLHSKYYPTKEGEKFINSNGKFYKNKDFVLVYGLGLGYHIIELLKKCSQNCSIYIFDADKEIVDIADSLGILENIKRDSRIKIVDNYSPNFLQEFVRIANMVEDVLIYKPSVKVLPDEYLSLKNLLEDYNVAKIAVDRFSEVMNENFTHNSRENYMTIQDFFNIMNVVGETVIIVASGPSLELSIESLKKVVGKVKIFSVGRALGMLMKNGIKPDMFTIIDAQEIVIEQIRGYENANIPLCFLSTASRWAVSSYNGPKFMFYNEQGNDDIIINTGKTVAVATLDIAIKSGASKIIFVGQDLGFFDNKSHPEANNIVPAEANYKKVMDVNGKMINTSEGYMYFKRQIEKEIEINPQVIFINCSKGAKIEGTLQMELLEALNLV